MRMFDVASFGKAAAVLCLTALFGVSAGAAPVTLQFSGVISDEFGGDSPLLGIGDLATVTLQYDTAPPALTGTYGLLGLVVSFGGYTGTAPEGSLSISLNSLHPFLTDTYADIVAVQSVALAGSPLGGAEPGEFGLSLIFPTGFLPGVQPPTTPYDVTQATEAFAELSFGGFYTRMTITSSAIVPQAAAVPLPAGLPLLALGLGALAVLRRRYHGTGSPRQS